MAGSAGRRSSGSSAPATTSTSGRPTAATTRGSVRALATGNGRIEADGVERDVAFEEAGPDVAAAVTAAFHAKYDHYGHETVDPVTSAESERATIRLVAR